MSGTSSADILNAESKNTVTLYAIWGKASVYKITYKLNKGKNNSSNPKTYTVKDEIKLKNPTRSGYHFAGWYTDSKYKQKIDVIKKEQPVRLLYMRNGQKKSVHRQKLRRSLR